MWISLASNGLSLLIVGMVAVSGAIGWGQKTYETAGPLESAICLRVAPGSTFSKVSTELEERGAVTSARLLRLGAGYADKTSDLKAGSFLVPAGTSMADIVDIVTRSGQSTCGTEVVYRVGINRIGVQVRELDPATNRYQETLAFTVGEPVPDGFAAVQTKVDTRYRIALAEGVTSWQIVEGLKAVDVLSGEVDEIPPEGFLAPDSYEIAVGDTRADLLDLMERRQRAILEAAWAARADNLPYATPEEALIMASIIEKETALSDERETVASVFVNRLQEPMPLQTDPTIIYGITRGQGVLGRGITRSDIRGLTEGRLHGAIEYNTYQIAGLPPTPIANPGRASIEAALNPADTDYIFFVAKSLDPKDGHHFTVEYADHQRFVAAYNRLQAAQD